MLPLDALLNDGWFFKVLLVRRVIFFFRRIALLI
jgi:hypothetical protein